MPTGMDELMDIVKKTIKAVHRDGELKIDAVVTQDESVLITFDADFQFGTIRLFESHLGRGWEFVTRKI